MKIIKKVISVLIACAFIIGATTLVTTGASIEDTAKSAESGKRYSSTIAMNKNVDYKITLNKSGTIKVDISTASSMVYVYLYDSDGNDIASSSVTMKSGQNYIVTQYKEDTVRLCWNSKVEKSVGSIEYDDIAKGTYYVRITRDSPIYFGNGKPNNGTGKTIVKITYPSEDSDNSDNNKISCLTLKMSKGDKIKLGAIVEPSDAEISWTSSKSDIVSVSQSGTVTAKKEGKAYITAKCGKSKCKIMIIVEDD